MPIQYDNLPQKTISALFPTWEEFWEEARKYALDATLSHKDKVSFHFVSWQWYNYWKEEEFIGTPEKTVSKMFSHLGTGFVSLNKREQLYLKLFPKIEEQFKLIEIKSTEKGKDKVDKKTETRNVKRITSKLEPQLALPDLISEAYGTHVKGIFPDDKFKSRADWTQSSSEISEGLKTANGIAPNFNKEKGILLDRDFTRITKQQPQQQVSRLVQCYNLVEYNLVSFLQEFTCYFDSWVNMPEEWTLDNLASGNLFKDDYQSRPAISEEEREKPKEKTIK